MPLYTAHKQLSLRWQHSVASGCPQGKRSAKVHISQSRASLQMSGGTSLLLLFVATHCPDHLWTRLADDPPRHQRHLSHPPPSSPPTLCSHCAFILKDKRIALIQTQMSNEKRVTVLELKSESAVQLGNKTGLSRMAKSRIWMAKCTNTRCCIHIEAKVKCQW